MITKFKSYLCSRLCTQDPKIPKEKATNFFENSLEHEKKKWNYPQLKSLPIQKDSTLVWDIENIDHKNLVKIYTRLGFVCEDNYIVSHELIYGKMRQRLNMLKEDLEKVEIITTKLDADSEIKQIINSETIKKTENIVIVSSDSDFANNANKITLDPTKSCFVVCKEIQKKGMLMRLKIDRNNLKIITL